MICAECGKEFDEQNAGYVNEAEGFFACKQCTLNVEEEWDDMKAYLKSEGIDPCSCTFIEDHIL